MTGSQKERNVVCIKHFFESTAIVLNEVIKYRIQVTLKKTIEQKHLLWYGHLQRMNEHRLPQKMEKRKTLQ